ncbi:hypothetical protein [Cyanobacterium sp. Dongsha4]|uniref:hypothetical protein n=1 Tax=Cyanobacterium sp. DS4 TaxID=2878255 RepID=UPI002E800F2D|nr:hypothetical protein [Cyanobacterium sp. Dongsha4]WVK99212.1 hypothetical protein Dongsha4_10950 [Cyanobacterium sp. Dongsha4]
MEAGEPSRKKKGIKQVSVEILGTLIALTTLTIPIFLITNFSDNSNSSPAKSLLLIPK